MSRTDHYDSKAELDGYGYDVITAIAVLPHSARLKAQAQLTSVLYGAYAVCKESGLDDGGAVATVLKRFGRPRQLARHYVSSWYKVNEPGNFYLGLLAAIFGAVPAFAVMVVLGLAAVAAERLGIGYLVRSLLWLSMIAFGALIGASAALLSPKNFLGVVAFAAGFALLQSLSLGLGGAFHVDRWRMFMDIFVSIGLPAVIMGLVIKRFRPGIIASLATSPRMVTYFVKKLHRD